MENLMIFEGKEVEVFELNGQVFLIHIIVDNV